jgi:hypothetical protein
VVAAIVGRLVPSALEDAFAIILAHANAAGHFKAGTESLSGRGS